MERGWIHVDGKQILALADNGLEDVGSQRVFVEKDLEGY